MIKETYVTLEENLHSTNPEIFIQLMDGLNTLRVHAIQTIFRSFGQASVDLPYQKRDCQKSI